MKHVLPIRSAAVLVALAISSTGCYAGAAGAGAEAGYVEAREGRSTGQVIDDQLIVTKIKTQLLADPVVSGLDINVDSYAGEVSLKGFVQSGREADRAMAIARSVAGVRDVRSQLVVE
jgi:hyperosmotically inducible periplasmic protein